MLDLDRRQFLTALAITVTSPASLCSKEEEKYQYRTAEVLDPLDGEIFRDPHARWRFTPKRFSELQDGDIFRLLDPDGNLSMQGEFEFWKALDNPYPVDAEIMTWGIEAEPWIPPKASTWNATLSNGQLLQLDLTLDIQVEGQVGVIRE